MGSINISVFWSSTGCNKQAGVQRINIKFLQVLHTVISASESLDYMALYNSFFLTDNVSEYA